MRRQCDGATCSYLGNGSAADIACPEGSPKGERSEANPAAFGRGEVSRGHSGRRAVVEGTSRGLEDARLNCEPTEGR